MNECQQTELVKKYPYQVMRSCLDWPFQKFFRETASRSLWPYFENNNANDNSFGSLLIAISKKTINDGLDYNYKVLFFAHFGLIAVMIIKLRLYMTGQLMAIYWQAYIRLMMNITSL